MLKKGQEFQWGPEQQQAFQQAKERIVSESGLITENGRILVYK